ncbi:MAG: transaldolase [Pseudomonadota bacterium]
MNQLELLQQHSVIVADTGELELIKTHQPQDATTNPSLILKVADLPEYQGLISDALEFARSQSASQGLNASDAVRCAAERLTVLIGCEISRVIPGLVSTEIDARLSFDTQAMVTKAEQFIEWYDSLGVSSDRVLIKIAATWEGIQAARVLESNGIRCNLTLLFALPQAQACADAGVYLISPFVGRITDWHTAQGKTFDAHNDPGVLSVKQIFSYYKTHGVSTVVMAASFRNTGQIMALSGCDRLTISPALLSELARLDGLNDQHDAQLSAELSAELNAELNAEPLNEADFRWAMNDSVMAAEKLADGIRKFAADAEALEALLSARL